MTLPPTLGVGIDVVEEMITETAAAGNRIAANSHGDWERAGAESGNRARLAVLVDVKARLVRRGMEYYEEAA